MFKLNLKPGMDEEMMRINELMEMPIRVLNHKLKIEIFHCENAALLETRFDKLIRKECKRSFMALAKMN